MIVASAVSIVVVEAGGALDEAAQVLGVDAGVVALVDDLDHVAGAEERQRDLQAAGAPAAGDRQLARAEGHLVAGDGDGLEQRPADLALGDGVEEAVAVAAGPPRRGRG